MTADEVKRARKILGLTQTELGSKLGVKLRAVQSWEGGDRNISKSAQKILQDLMREYAQSEDAQSAPAHLKVNDPFEQYAITSKNGHETYNMPGGGFMMKVPLIPIKAYARFISEGDSVEFLSEMENVYFKVDHIGKGRYRAIEVKGDSFWNGGGYDTPDKAIALIRELDRNQWKDGFRDSELGWVIFTKNNAVLKDIVNQDLTNGIIKCHSRNPSPEYSDFTLSLDEDVTSIWKVIKRQF